MFCTRTIDASSIYQWTFSLLFLLLFFPLFLLRFSSANKRVRKSASSFSSAGGPARLSIYFSFWEPAGSVTHWNRLGDASPEAQQVEDRELSNVFAIGCLQLDRIILIRLKLALGTGSHRQEGGMNPWNLNHLNQFKMEHLEHINFHIYEWKRCWCLTSSSSSWTGASSFPTRRNSRSRSSPRRGGGGGGGGGGRSVPIFIEQKKTSLCGGRFSTRHQSQRLQFFRLLLLLLGADSSAVVILGPQKKEEGKIFSRVETKTPRL